MKIKKLKVLILRFFYICNLLLAVEFPVALIAKICGVGISWGWVIWPLISVWCVELLAGLCVIYAVLKEENK